MASWRGRSGIRLSAMPNEARCLEPGAPARARRVSALGTALLFTLATFCVVPRLSGQKAAAAGTSSRGIAVTFDDLPAMSAMSMSAPSITDVNRKILDELVSEKVPSIGFVNEIRLYKTGETDARIAVLEAWLSAGFELGNHTFSHTSLNHAELKDWEDDVVQGESVTRMLLRNHGKTLRYLRHPYLDTGADLLTRRQAEAYLTGRGYRVAPVTIDPLDWYFADLYDDARAHGDGTAEGRIVQAWLAYAEQSFAYSEGRSRALLGYEPKQVLLLHDTPLEADHLRELLALIRARGYAFLTLDDALTDKAYAQPDEYISDVGATWIDHWAVTRGQIEAPGLRPHLPEWIEKRHAALELDASK